MEGMFAPDDEGTQEPAGGIAAPGRPITAPPARPIVQRPRPAPGASPVVPSVNPWGKNGVDPLADTRLDQSVRLGQQTPAAQAGTVLGLKRKTGLPVDVVARNTEVVQSDEQRKAVADLQRDYPVVAGWMREHPLHSSVASPDLAGFQAIEGAATALRLGFQGGRLQSRVAEEDFAALSGDGPVDPMSIQMRETRRARSAVAPLNPTRFQDILFNTGKLVGQMVPGVPETAKGAIQGATVGMLAVGAAAIAGATSPVTVPAAALVGATAGIFNYTARQEAGSAYQGLGEIRGTNGETIPESVKRPAAMAVGALNGAIELALDVPIFAPFKAVARKFSANVATDLLARPTMRKAMATFGEHYLTALAAEPTQEVAQELTNVVAEEFAKQVSTGHFSTLMNSPEEREAAIARLADIAEQTVKGTLLLAGVGPSVRMGTDILAARAASQREQHFLALGEALDKASGPAKESDGSTEVAARALGGSSFFIDPEPFTEYFQKQGVDPREAAREIWGSAAPYDEAVQAGHAIEISARTYASKVAPTEANTFFAEELRVGAPDVMNAREGAQFATSLAEEHARRTEEAQAAAEGDDARNQLVSQIAATITATGMHRPQDATTLAEPLADFVHTMARRTGMEPAAFWTQYGPQIIGPEGAQGEGALQQSVDQTETPEFKAFFEGSKVVDQGGKPLVVYHGTRHDFAKFNIERRPQFFTSSPGVASAYAVRYGGERTAEQLELEKQYEALRERHGKQEAHRTPEWAALDEQMRALGARVVPVYLAMRNPLEVLPGTRLHDAIQDRKDDRDFYRRLREEGHDGLIVRSIVDPPRSYTAEDRRMATEPADLFVPLYPEQIKSAIGNRGTFDPSNPNILFQLPEPTSRAEAFYSRLSRAIAAAPFNKGTAEQWVAALSKNVAKGEREWTGMDRFLADNAGRVLTRDQVTEQFEENRIRITESVARSHQPERDAVMGRARDTRDALEARDGGRPAATAVRNGMSNERAAEAGHFELTPEIEAAMDEYRAAHAAAVAIGREQRGSPKFAQYTEPGGENYREIKIQLAPSDAKNAEAFEFFPKTGEGLFHSSHFDEPNILAHVRVNDRALPNGEKVLFVEEVQSDWHQQGREHGYASGVKRGADEEGYFVTDARGRELFRAPNEREVTNYINENNLSPEGVPDAPFKKTDEWLGLAMKRVIEEAVQGGYDRIAWTTGEQQAARYDLSKQVDLVKYNEKTGEFIAEQDGEEVHSGTYDAKALPSVIGKEAAKRLADAPINRDGFSVLDGEGLKVGGEGMRAFYDNILPGWVKEYAKKMGVRLEIAPLGGERQAQRSVEAIDADMDAVLTELDAREPDGPATGEMSADAWERHHDLLARYRALQDERNVARGFTSIDLASNQSFRVSADLRSKVLTEGQPLYQLSDQTETPAFKRWYKGSKVVESDGTPIRLYHGTTGDFDIFDPTRANVESDWGAGIYLSNTPDDVATNYAGLGPDLTNKIERRAEQWMSEQEIQDDTFNERYPTFSDKIRVAREAVRAEFMTHEGATVPLWAKIKKPFQVGGPDETVLTYRNGRGTLFKFIAALRDAASRFDGGEVDGVIEELAGRGDDLTASEVSDIVRGDEQFGYFEDENGNLAGHEVLRLAIERAGFDGIIDHTVNDKFGTGRQQGQQMKGMDEDTVHYIAFSPNQLKSAIGNSGRFDPNNPSILAQERARGSIRLGVQGGAVIQLNANANLSTFLHETGHLYLDVLGRLAIDHPDIAADYAILLNHIGATPGEPITREQHEIAARSFEAYVMEGKAPSVALRRAFARFRTWLLALYRSVKGLHVELSDEVRGVFDRMLATDAEIAAARQGAGLEPVFTDAASAGMTDEQFAAYQQEIDDANTTANDMLRAQVLRQYMRERDVWWRDARREMRAEVESEVNEQQDYATLIALQTRTAADGTPMARLSKDGIVALMGEDFAVRTRPMRIWQVQDGLSIEQAAEQFGYDSPDAMLKALVAAPPRTQAIEQTTDQRMAARYGDMVSDGTLADHAEVAVLNEHTDAVIRAEMRALFALSKAAPEAEQAGARAEAGREAVRTETGRARVAAAIPDPAWVATLAQQRLALLRVRDIKPLVYWTAARRASKLAVELMGSKDYIGASNAKQSELLNNELFRQATKIREESDAIQEYVRGLQSPRKQAALGKAGADYLDQVNALLERFDFSRITNRESDRRASLAAFIAAQDALGLPVNISEQVQDLAFRTPWREMTIEELQGVRDTLKHIDHLATLKNKLLRSVAKRDLDDARDQVASTVVANAKRTIPPNAETTLPTQGRAVRAIQGFVAAHRKLASFIREMDGYVDGGPIWDLVMRPLNDAADQQSVFNADATQRLEAIFAAHYSKADTRGLYTKTATGGALGSLSKMGRLMMALNWGTEDNQQKLVAGLQQTFGDHVDETDVAGVLNSLDARDWKFVQDVWEFIGSYWPAIKALAERLDGIAPEKVEGVPVNTRFGQIDGAYFPLSYDQSQSTLSHHDRISVTADEVRSGETARRSTKAGSRNSRVSNVQSPLRLDFGVIREHLTALSQDLTHTETLIDVGRIMTGHVVKSAIREHYGDVVYQEMLKSIDGVAAGIIPPQNAFDAALGYIRAGTTVAGLGWNVVTSALQPLGLTNSMVRVGPTWIAKGLAEWIGEAAHMENTAKWIGAKSPMMLHRTTTQMREVSELMNTIGFNQGMVAALADQGIDKVTMGTLDLNDVRQSYFWFITRMQLVADIPTWLGAYRKALAGMSLDEVDDARAVALADQAVLDSQSGGALKDLASVQRGSPALKLWTTFYSFMNLAWNQHVEAVGRTDFRSAKSVGRLATDLLLLSVVPVILGYELKRVLRGNDDEPDAEERLVAWAREELSFLTGMLLGLREVSGVINGFHGYEGPTGARFFSAVGTLAQQTAQGESDRALWSSLNATAGILFHYPSGQVQRTVDGLMALEAGRSHNWLAPLVGGTK